ncbi:Hpt domain-containing protein [Dactylosporangium sp. NPDC006015]|uniref:Hpt domain-containing protein n=1 Tax=Dactylosporangium sp. NPDC006015 TaxID=3154576 RepID=UPI0033A23B47
MDRAAGIRARLDDVAGPDPSPDDLAMLARLLTAFTTRTPPAVDRLAVAMHAGDTAAVHVQAHALKGSAANIGGTALADLLADLEQRARGGGGLPDAGPALDRIRTEYTEVAAICEALAGSRSAL